MKSIKTRIAAGATILGLGGLTGLALSAGHQRAAQPVATKPLVRTKVIRRTIHVTKHARPGQTAGAAPVPGAAGAAAYGGGASTGEASVTTGSSSVGSTSSSYEAAPVTTSTSGASSAPGSSTSAPIVTHASGAGGGGGESEHESERGDD